MLVILVFLIILIISLFFLFNKNINSGTEIEMTSKDLKITVVDTKDCCDDACELLLKNMELHTLGFDAEWVTIGDERQPVALLQLSNLHYCVLFRLNILKCVPEALANILTDETVIKVGVVPENDALFLFNDYGVLTKSTLDLRHLFRRSIGLSALANKVLNITMKKDNHVRCSNWESEELSTDQIEYAALDAQVAFKLYKYYFDNNNCDLINGILQAHLNETFKAKQTNNCQETRTDRKRKEKIPRLMIHRPIPNCRLYAPNGTLLAFTDKSRGLYYVLKNRGEVICEEPFSVRLLFEPKKIPGEDECLYEKEEIFYICVVCGSDAQLVKHHIVPKMFIYLFPLSLKCYNSHDIQFVCNKCYRLVQSAFDKLLKQLKKIINYKEISSSSKFIAQKYAKALLIYDHVAGQERKDKMSAFILEHTDLTEISKESLEKLLQKETARKENQFAQSVVNYFSSDGRTLQQLQRMCRQSFVSGLNPQFLPKHWSVDTKKNCFKGEPTEWQENCVEPREAPNKPNEDNLIEDIRSMQEA